MSQRSQQPQQSQQSQQPQQSQSSEGSAPVFKVQILASDRVLKAGNPQLKGRQDATYYKEKGLYKYTVGASTNYNEINQLRRTLTASFPGAFVIAFRGDQKMDVNAAIAEWRKKK